jgi:hypothetical protein
MPSRLKLEFKEVVKEPQILLRKFLAAAVSEESMPREEPIAGEQGNSLSELGSWEKKHLLPTRQDEFLDAYSEWFKTKRPPAKRKLMLTAKELARLNPEFHFILPE